MKILSETIHTGERIVYCSIGVILSLLFLAMAIGFIWELIKGSAGVSEIVGLICVAAIAVLLSFTTYFIITDGARVSHKATVTDFNVVYEQGYRIVSQDGEIYLLEKED